MYQQMYPKTSILKNVSEYIDRLPFDIHGKNVCICLSGGADSVALLRVFLFLKEKYSFNVTACHFNHCIRGDESDSDEAFCKNLCDELGVEIYLGRDDVVAFSKLNKQSLEESARVCRYAFFKRILSKSTIDFCATAHNMNDDAETLLLNLIRGSGVNGATAIEPYNFCYLRPFLSVKRSEIEDFLLEIGQDFVVDSTNNSNDYTRNYLRNSVFPLLETLNPSVADAFSRFIQSNRVDRDFFEKHIDKLIDDDLRELHPALRARIILRKYKEFSGRILNASILNEIEKALLSDKRSVIPVFSDDEVIVYNGRIVFNKKISCGLNYPEQILEIGNNQVFGNNLSVVYDSECSEYSDLLIDKQFLRKDNIYGEIKVRQRKTGDKITIKGVNKNLKKLFIDCKIPKEYRNIIPIFFDDKGIIYVPFVGISDRVFVNNSRETIKITTVFNTIDKERWSISYEE